MYIRTISSSSPMTFRFSAKHLFLTYACPTTEHEIFTRDNLFDFLTKLDPSYLVVCQEQHENETPHFHALISFKKRVNYKDPRKLDFHNWHPKWETPRNVAASITYVKKDGVFKEQGEQVVGLDYTERAKDFDSKSEWLSWCVSNHIGFNYAMAFWTLANPPPSATVHESDEEEGTLCAALSTFKFTEWDTKACILVGPTGCGKTIWAKRNAPKPALMVSHIDQLRDFDPYTHKSIIFDDMVFKHFPVQSQIHLVDQYEDRAVHCRYNAAIIPKKTPKIFTCNERPVDSHPAINRRVRVFNIQPTPWGQEEEPRVIQ